MSAHFQKRGVYILGNDKVTDDALAFMNSFRCNVSDYQVVLIPYDDNYHRLMEQLSAMYGVKVFEEPELFEWLDRFSVDIHGYPVRLYRKLAAWFGPLDEFVYMDLDMVVFHDLSRVFAELTGTDFVHFGNQPLEQVFSPEALDMHVLNLSEMKDLFNAGFFGSKKGVVTAESLTAIMADAREVASVFFKINGDQPFLNYLVLRAIPNRRQLTSELGIPTEGWAGRTDLVVKDGKAYRNDGRGLHPLLFLHWAGMNRVKLRRPYVDLWLGYRYPGTRYALHRWLLKRLWFVEAVVERVLCSSSPEWYKPRYQLKRLGRIAARMFDRLT